MSDYDDIGALKCAVGHLCLMPDFVIRLVWQAFCVQRFGMQSVGLNPDNLERFRWWFHQRMAT